MSRHLITNIEKENIIKVWKPLHVVGCDECDGMVAKYGHAAIACTPCIDHGDPVMMEVTQADRWMDYMDRTIINTKEDIDRMKEKKNGCK